MRINNKKKMATEFENVDLQIWKKHNEIKTWEKS